MCVAGCPPPNAIEIYREVQADEEWEVAAEQTAPRTQGSWVDIRSWFRSDESKDGRTVPGVPLATGEAESVLLQVQHLLPQELDRRLGNRCTAAEYLHYDSSLTLASTFALHLYLALEQRRSTPSRYGVRDVGPHPCPARSEEVRHVLDGCEDLGQVRRRLFRWYHARTQRLWPRSPHGLFRCSRRLQGMEVGPPGDDGLVARGTGMPAPPGHACPDPPTPPSRAHPYMGTGRTARRNEPGSDGKPHGWSWTQPHWGRLAVYRPHG